MLIFLFYSDFLTSEVGEVLSDGESVKKSARLTRTRVHHQIISCSNLPMFSEHKISKSDSFF